MAILFHQMFPLCSPVFSMCLYGSKKTNSAETCRDSPLLDEVRSRQSRVPAPDSTINRQVCDYEATGLQAEASRNGRSVDIPADGTHLMVQYIIQ